jgi:hypothetical protein
VLINARLIAACQINNRQSSVAELHGAVTYDSAAIRPTGSHGLQRGVNKVWVASVFGVQIQPTDYPAHRC